MSIAKFLEVTKGPEELRQAVANKELGPGTANWLYSVIEQLGGEKAEMIKQAGGAQERDTRAEAQQKLDEIYAQDGRDGNRMHPFFDNAHPQHDAWVNKVVKLVQQAEGGEDSIDALRAGAWSGEM